VSPLYGLIIRIRRGEKLVFKSGDIISRQSQIELDGNGSELVFDSGHGQRGVQVFRKLAVGNDTGILNFMNNGKNEIFIDDLVINNDAYLSIKGWNRYFDDHLFVKKTSSYLQYALSRIKFEHHKYENVGVRDYNRDYWEIGVGAGFRPLPEPATYGAAVSVASLGLWAFRCRKRRTENLARENAS